MPATLTSHSDYYQHSQHSYLLKTAVCKEGTSQHLILFQYLLDATFWAVDKQTQQKIMFFDCRAAQSLLFLFPPKLQTLLSILFYREDLYIRDEFCSKDDVVITYNVQSNVYLPSEILLLNSKISKVPFGATLLNIIDKPNLREEEIRFILGLKKISPLFSDKDYHTYEKIDRIFNYCDYISPLNEPFKDIVSNNNRVESAVLICQSLGYSPNSIQEVAEVYELWTMNHSGI